MNKIAYIIPGYEGDLHLNNVRFVSALFRKQNIIPVPIKITWKYRTMTDYLIEFFAQIRFDNKYEIYLFGFSYGAMIAFLAAPLLHPKKLYLCSLSPYFKEDILHSNKQSVRVSIGKKREADFRSISFNVVAPSVKCTTLLFVGEQETASVINRTYQAKDRIKKSKMHLIKHATHNLNDARYQESLQDFIR